jgi:RTC4-like domain
MAIRAVQTKPQRQPSPDADIYAEPISSGDEEMDEAKTPEPTPRTKRINQGFKELDEKILRRRRGVEEEKAAAKAETRKGRSTSARQTRAKKVLMDDPMEISLLGDEQQNKQRSEEEGISEDEKRMKDWQQPPPKKMRIGSQNHYHSSAISNIHASAPSTKRGPGFQSVPDMVSPSRPSRNTRSGIQIPDEIGLPAASDNKPAHYVPPPADDLPDRRKTRSSVTSHEHSIKLPDDILSPRTVTRGHQTFKPVPETSTTSSATTADQAPTVFSHPDSSPLRHSRSRSASSLSSVGSVASLLLTQDEKDELMKADTTGQHEAAAISNTHTAQCPLCLTPVSNTHLEEFAIRHSKFPSTRLPSRLQQKFCREHRVQTAEKTWQARGYPTIDWDELATIRVKRHIPAIRSILQNETPSYYRDRLVEATTQQHAKQKKSTTSRKGLQRYLKEGVLDVVKYGYYGPLGAKIAAEGIMLHLSFDLVEAAEKNGLVREVGASGFVQAVLGVEMVGRWVAEDRRMRLKGGALGEDVRLVLNESAEVGMLVNEDEDRVVVRTDEEEKREDRGGEEGRVIEIDD